VATICNSFRDWIISHLLWLAYLPNLMPWHFTSRGSLKDSVMQTPHRQIMSLKKLSGVQYQQYLNTNFKECLIICSPGVTHIESRRSLPTYAIIQRKLYDTSSEYRYSE
jgi:hypothetical protein